MTRAVWLLAFLAFNGVATASSFKVNPIKFFFDERSKSAVLKLTNTSDKAVTIQLEAKSWTQDKVGDDQFLVTKDIIFFPRIVKIKVGEQRIVRIGYRGDIPERQEKYYRLFAQELPSQAAKQGALNFAFRFSMPVFVSPRRDTRENARLNQVTMDKGKLLVDVFNRGSEHTIVKKIYVTGYGKGSRPVFTTVGNGWYVLPGAQKQFSVALNEVSCLRADRLKIKMKAGGEDLVTEVKVDKSQCIPEHDPAKDQLAGNQP